MEKNTLYQAERFLIFLLGLYGFNESKSMLKVFYNLIVKVVGFIYVFMPIVLYLYSTWESREKKNSKHTAYFAVHLFCGANISCFLLCYFRKRNFNALLKVLKRYKVSPKLSKKIRHWNIFLAFFAYPIYIIWHTGQSVRIKNYSLCGIVVAVGITNIFLLLVHCLPFCSLPVLFNIHYINLTLNEKVEEIKKCKSPLRRARLTTRLILFSTHLNPLVKATNDYGAPVMFVLKATATIISVISIYGGFICLKIFDLETQLKKSVTNVPPLLIFLIYLWYMRVAPSANQIPSLMARVMVENVMRDEQWMSRDPISRTQLLKTRLVQLAHLTHSHFNQAQLTVLGEPVDETDILEVFADLFDNYNSYISALW